MAKHSSFESFGKAILRRADEVQAHAPDIIRKATIASLNAITYATPVDEGRARANWNVSQGQPDLSLTESTDAESSVSEGVSKAQDYKSGLGANLITNNLEYIGALENGSSSQAPSGMIRFGVNAARKVFNSAKIFRSK